MAIIPLSDSVSVVQIRAQWSYLANGAGESSWSFIMPRAAGDSRAFVLGRWMTYLLTEYLAARSGDFYLVRLLAEDRWPGTLPALIDDSGWIPPPDDGSAPTPPQISPLISWRTGEIGRQNRGRTYMGPYTCLSVFGDEVQNPAENACYDFAEAMMYRFGPGTIPGNPRFSIVSRIQQSPTYPFGHFCPVETYYFFGEWATMRRRMRYRWET